MKDAEKYAEELGVDISTDEGKIKSSIQEARISQTKEAIANQPWLGSITKQRWESEDSRSGFPWLNGWKGCPTDIVADMEEIIQQLIPTHVYYSSKLGQNVNTTLCRLCQTKPETVLHLLSGCPRLSQTEYLYRHNNVLKCLYFALLLNNLASLKQFHFQTVASNQSPQRRRTT